MTLHLICPVTFSILCGLVTKVSAASPRRNQSCRQNISGASLSPSTPSIPLGKPHSSPGRVQSHRPLDVFKQTHWKEGGGLLIFKKKAHTIHSSVCCFSNPIVRDIPQVRKKNVELCLIFFIAAHHSTPCSYPNAFSRSSMGGSPSSFPVSGLFCQKHPCLCVLGCWYFPSCRTDSSKWDGLWAKTCGRRVFVNAARSFPTIASVPVFPGNV